LANQPKILVTESTDFSPAVAELLRQHGELILSDLDRPGLLAAVCDANVMWVRLRHYIDAEVLDAAPRLSVIVSPTTGVNHIDVTRAERRGIRLVSLRGEAEFLKTVRGAAEHTMALMLALLRRLPAAFAHVQGEGWDRTLFEGRELYGKTVGVVGYGRLGRIIGGYLQAFGSRVLASDPNVRPDQVEPGVTLLALKELLKEADLVTLHVDLSDKTRSFFGANEFAAMKNGAWFINTARGELVEEHALLEALRSGKLGGAALDVLAGEYSDITKHPLVEYARTHENLIITPHVGGLTRESIEKTELFLANRLADLIRSQHMPSCG